MRSAASAAPNTDEGGYASARNISANSLIDANALPSWMQPEQPQPPQQNIAASQSSIRDTNLSSEIVDFTKNQILVQAGTSALAQANQAPQSVLKLLG